MHTTAKQAEKKAEKCKPKEAQQYMPEGSAQLNFDAGLAHHVLANLSMNGNKQLTRPLGRDLQGTR
jgi:hypothetical protein